MSLRGNLVSGGALRKDDLVVAAADYRLIAGTLDCTSYRRCRRAEMNALETGLEAGRGNRQQHTDDRHHHNEFKQSGSCGARLSKARRLGAARGGEF